TALELPQRQAKPSGKASSILVIHHDLQCAAAVGALSAVNLAPDRVRRLLYNRIQLLIRHPQPVLDESAKTPVLILPPDRVTLYQRYLRDDLLIRHRVTSSLTTIEYGFFDQCRFTAKGNDVCFCSELTCGMPS